MKSFNAALIYCVAALAAGIFISAFYAEEKLLDSLNEKAAMLKKYDRLSRYIPIEKGIVRLNSDRKNLEQLYEKSLEHYNIPKGAKSSRLEPKAMKDELSNVENSLRAMAKEAGTELPASLGLDEYKAKTKDQEKAEEFYSKMRAASRLIIAALNSKILKIDQIQVGDAVLKEPIRKNDDIVYLEVPITLAATSSSKALMNFLYQLSYSKDIFVIKNINAITPASDDKSRKKMTMTISFINFLNLK